MKRIPIPLFGGWLYAARTRDEFDAHEKRLAAKAGMVVDQARASVEWGASTSYVVGTELHVLAGAFCSEPDVACHEAVHGAQAVAKHALLDPLKEEESFAYLVQWFFERLTEARNA